MDRPWLALAIEHSMSDDWIELDSKIIEKVIKTMWEIISKELVKWNQVRLYNFAKFSITQRKQRNWINPSKMEHMVIPAHKTVKFTACTNLKHKINS